MDNGNGQKSTSSSSSPLPPNPAIRTISFAEAIDEIRRGKKITKVEWENKDYYGFLHEAKLCLHKPDNTLHDWIISEGDIIGNDWMVV